MRDISIRKAEGGYILTDRLGMEKLYTTTEDLFRYLLLHFEGLSETFLGDSFGRVTIERHQVRSIQLEK